jgi:hypothetical protein
MSWTNDTSKSVHEHEQGHFDMGEIAARQYRKACDAILFSKSVNKKFMDSLFSYYDKELEQMNNFYDSTIKQDPYMQSILLEKIAKDLHTLRTYERHGKGLLKL